MPVTEAHPSADELAAFTLGTLDDETQDSIEAHVAACTFCQERAAGAPGDSLVELLRRVQARSAIVADTVTEAPQAHTPAPRLREAMAAALPYASPADSDAANDLHAIPPELARHERYRVVRLLGQGGMGSVYEAEQIAMQRRVALKVIRRADSASPATLERFRREVRAAARLSHPNIVTAYDAETAGELHFLVMEYAEGISLTWLVKERGPLPIDEACDYVRQAAQGLQHAHEKGLVHRDIKPDNLIRCSDGTVKILDFGLAALTAEGGGGLTEANVVMGTPEYMAPEQAEDSHRTDIRADHYSLGCTLYYLLTGTPPYPAPTPLLKVLAHRDRPVPPLRRARPDAPPELAAVVGRLLAKTPEDRYQTPRELADALTPFTRPAARPTHKRGSLLVAAAVAALFAGIVLAGAAVYRIQTDKGELVIETDNDDVEVVVRKGGEVVKIIDTKSGKHVTLNSGDYELALKDGKEGLKLSPGKMTLKRGETKLATITAVSVEKEEVGEVRLFNGHTTCVTGVVFLNDGRRFVSCGDSDQTIRVWDVATGKELARFGNDDVTFDCLALCPDQRHLLSGGQVTNWNGSVSLWDLETGKELARFGGFGRVGGLAVSPDGQWALAGTMDQTFRLLDLKDRKAVHRFVCTDRVQDVAIRSDGRLAASASWDGTVRLWDLEKRTEIACLRRHTGQVTGVAFSPDGSLLLTGGADKTVRFWDVQRRKQLNSVQNHLEGVRRVAFSPDGRRALSAGLDCTVRLWDVNTGKELHCFTGHRSGVVCVAFSPDGRFALSGGGDCTIRLWRLPDPPPAKEKP
jgi:WD40 repeat protein/tRNA A-37 threonylcarbamoyl transferase component Bud32